MIIPQGFTAERLVTGEADLAVQQISELKQVAGIEVVGPIPHELQTPAVFSAGRMAASNKADAGGPAAAVSRFARGRAGAARERAGALNLPALRRNLRGHEEAISRLAVVVAARRRGAGVWRMRNRPISCCATVSPPIPPIPTSRPTSKGVPDIAASDIATAIKFCKSAANSSRRAMYQLGRAYAANRQTAEAMAAWRKAADKGSTSAMVELGVLYGTGAGVASDEAQARKLFERAAQAGNPRGVSNLAALGGGAGAAADPARARELLSKAAETNAEAQYQLGMMLAEGNGGAKDDAAARALFEKAAAQNHPGALERMGAFAQEGRGGPKDSDAAKAYYRARRRARR